MFRRLRRRARLLLALATVAVFSVACVAQADTLSHTHNVWWHSLLLGAWQGFILPFTFVISLFDKHVGIYSLHNTGNWYNFGFVIGTFIIFGVVWHGHHVRKLRRSS